MPHVTVKLWPGKSEKQKKSLAEAITKDIISARDTGTLRGDSALWRTFRFRGDGRSQTGRVGGESL